MITSIRVGFTAGRGPIGAAIRHVDRDPDGRPSAINHVLLRVTYPDIDLIFQSHGVRGVGLCYTSDIVRAVHELRVFRYAEQRLFLSSDDLVRADHRMRHISGRGYDHWQILLYYAAKRLGFGGATKHGISGRYTCNEAVWHVLKGLVPCWIGDVAKTPAEIFYDAFGETSNDYFQRHSAIDFHNGGCL